MAGEKSNLLDPQQEKRKVPVRRWLLYGILFFFVLGLILVLVIATANNSALTKFEIPDERYDYSTVCNDGSPSLVYVRQVSGSDKWIFNIAADFLYCFDESTCGSRDDNLKTSLLAPKTLEPDGIWSNDCDLNPEWCEFNIGWVHYCSSDMFTGNASAEDNFGLHFNGYNIVQAALDTLIQDHGLGDATEIFVTAQGGSGVGLLFSYDSVLNVLQTRVPNAPVKTLIDSGWRTNRDPIYDESRTSCDGVTLAQECSLEASIAVGVGLWQPVYSSTLCPQESADCYFAHNVWDSALMSDIFVCMYQYDHAQLDMDGANFWDDQEFTDAAMVEYSQNAAQSLLEDEVVPLTDYGFWPSCWDHEFIERWDVHEIEINGYNLYDAIRDWYNGAGTLRYDDEWTIASNPTCLFP